MKPGSLVILIDDNWVEGYLTAVYKKLPVKGKIYTIREIVLNPRDGEPYCHLEEIINPIVLTDLGDRGEGYFACFRFREVQPPIANIEEHINENTLEPVLI